MVEPHGAKIKKKTRKFMHGLFEIRISGDFLA